MRLKNILYSFLLFKIALVSSDSFSQQSSFKDHLSFEVGPNAYMFNFSEQGEYVIENLQLGVNSEFIGLDFSGSARYHFNSHHSIGIGCNFFMKNDKQTYYINNEKTIKRANFFFSSFQLDYRYSFSDHFQASLGLSIPIWEKYETSSIQNGDSYSYTSSDDFWQSYDPIDTYSTKVRLGILYIVPLNFYFTIHPRVSLNIGLSGFISEYKYTYLKDYKDNHYHFFASICGGIRYRFGHFIKEKTTKN